MQPDITDAIPKSGKGMAKQTSRFAASYWLDRVYRPRYKQDGAYIEVAEWFARIQHGGRREAIGLATNEREQAARTAARLYQSIRSKGWTEALRQFAPDRAAVPNKETIGAYLELIRPLFPGRQITWNNYAYALRRIATDIAGIQDNDKKKFNPSAKPWQERANNLKLTILTPAAITGWQNKFIERSGENHVLRRRAVRSAASFILNARSLFGRKMSNLLRAHKYQVPENPFDGVAVQVRDPYYVSTINAAELLKKAKKDLARKFPETWKVILLALGAGLRRGEIDSLCRTQIDFDKAQIRIITSAHFETKTEESQNTVYVDNGLLNELRKHLSPGSLFVIDPNVLPSKAKAKAYRTRDTLRHATGWLCKNGVNSFKPLHALRKEFGSIINEQSDIHTASRQLRHSSIKTTAAHYTDNRRRSAVPIGELMARKVAVK